MANNASVATEAIFTSPALRPVCENLLVGGASPNPALRADLARSVSVALLLMRHSP